MQHNKSIVYLGTENNAKSCMGLQAVVMDGWNVKLVIAYDSCQNESKQKSIKGKLYCYFRGAFQICYEFLRKKCLKNESFPNMLDICHSFYIPYHATTDKSLLNFGSIIEKVSPCVILSNGWQFKISEVIFNKARIIALNCHSSYLPEYRGGNVTYAPLINEEKQSGVTVHQLVKKFDAGPILAQERVQIDQDETPYSLNLKRARVTGKVLISALEIAGNPELYKPNPPSPFYFRCDYSTYKKYKRQNFFRKLVGLPIKRYKPKESYDI